MVVIVCISCSSPSTIRSQSDVNQINTGYMVLLLFLENQKNLTKLGRVKAMFMLKDINKTSADLILKITKSSEEALLDLEKLALKNRRFLLKSFQKTLLVKPHLIRCVLPRQKNFFLIRKTLKRIFYLVRRKY